MASLLVFTITVKEKGGISLTDSKKAKVEQGELNEELSK
jgi:hypothetical protein